jgi:GntR family transcriptional repressor for pyruvate dehydrogenase complex
VSADPQLPVSHLRSHGRQPLKDRVLAMIVDALRAGAYRESDRLPSERTLATQLGVSRAIVSLAIDDLVQQGVLESRRGRGGGTFVVSVADLPTTDDRLPGDRRDVMVWLLEAREPVELAVALLVARRGRIGELRDLRQIYREMVEAVDEGTGEYASIAMRFNLRLAEASENPLLREIVRQLVNEQAALRQEFTVEPTTDELKVVLSAHSELLDAMESGESDAIANAVRRHVAGVRQIYLGTSEPPSPGFIDIVLSRRH